MRTLLLAGIVGAVYATAAQGQLPSAVRREAIEWADSGGVTRGIMWSPMGTGKEAPTLFFAPDSGQRPSDYSTLLHAWASRGFVVIALEQSLPPALLAALDHVLQEQRADVLPFRRVDRSRVGVVGHGAGGSAAANACALDQRFRACMSLDATLSGAVLQTGTGDQPFFLLKKRVRSNVAEDSVWAHTRRMYWLIVDQMDHAAFTDAALDESRLTEAKQLIGLAFPSRKIQDMTTRFVVDFFGVHLSGARGPTTLDQNPFPRTTLKRTP